MTRALREDTIAAISTPLGEGAIAVIRISGKHALDCIGPIFKSSQPLDKTTSHRAIHGWIVDYEETVDEVVVTYFAGPHSYTGEDVVEISCHGGYYLPGRILELVCKMGARPALPGEFTQRAFLNGKMDLVQAEAVADLIRSKTEAGRKSAILQLRGELSKRISHLRAQLIEICSLLELELDFSEEDVVFASREDMVQKLEKILEVIQKLLSGFEVGRIYREGIRIVLIGKPNVGKSSVMNCLLEKERVLVTEIPGTTRDTVEDVLDISGVVAMITDTAGIRDTEDPIEKESIKRAQQAFEQADLVLCVLDLSVPLSKEDLDLIQMVKAKQKKTFFIFNKMDLPSQWEKTSLDLPENATIFKISALKKEGILELLNALRSEVHFGAFQKDEVLLTNIRHKNALESAMQKIHHARSSLLNGLSQEFVSVDLRGAMEELAEITGEIVTEEILDHIFSHFCIGK